MATWCEKDGNFTNLKAKHELICRYVAINYYIAPPQNWFISKSSASKHKNINCYYEDWTISLSSSLFTYSVTVVGVFFPQLVSFHMF